MAENFPNLEKETDVQIQEAQRVPYRINPRRNRPRHILIKLPKKAKQLYSENYKMLMIETEDDTY